MDGDIVQEKRLDRNLQLEYNYDRLIDIKLIQAYQLLVPDKAWKKDINQEGRDGEHETSGHIRQSVIGPSKRRAHY